MYMIAEKQIKNPPNILTKVIDRWGENLIFLIMKKLFFGILILILAITSSYAGAPVKNSSQYTISNDQKVSINLGDITNMSEYTIQQKIEESLKQITNEDLDCEIKISGDVKIFFFSVHIEITVKGPCQEVLQKASNIAKTLMENVKNSLLSH
jgi:hypothetical protein